MRDGVWWDKTRVMTREDKYAWRLRVKRSIMRAHERLHGKGGGGSTFHKTELAWWRRSGEGRSGVWDAAEGADVAFQEELEGSLRLANTSLIRQVLPATICR